MKYPVHHAVFALVALTAALPAPAADTVSCTGPASTFHNTATAAPVSTKLHFELDAVKCTISSAPPDAVTWSFTSNGFTSDGTCDGTAQRLGTTALDSDKGVLTVTSVLQPGATASGKAELLLKVNHNYTAATVTFNNSAPANPGLTVEYVKDVRLTTTTGAAAQEQLVTGSTGTGAIRVIPSATSTTGYGDLTTGDPDGTPLHWLIPTADSSTTPGWVLSVGPTYDVKINPDPVPPGVYTGSATIELTCE
ncbi:hypothetical protein [Burkholderia sp. ABCPW 14]|uniref:hypothetical protein n=1 Tax=Burkholderia sp. ABCPW 14 TaxID=1637860 RepID=UPI0009EC6220|nr:hypothetical protein [Burkholderia sp. ABCPW 14]